MSSLLFKILVNLSKLSLVLIVFKTSKNTLLENSWVTSLNLSLVLKWLKNVQIFETNSKWKLFFSLMSFKNSSRYFSKAESP
ncbi:hypothetical protein [Mycoplasmopsis cynos]|uniref:hypothetical protein n=1 Tax=Mycoplasmopsis cynos TaxID=171284 RepID=UPI0022097195|nr:hypothetical protein [Mycoplasmopsis cynos]UWV83303.1 hypothetical protein NW067_03755 [Mycoplasmopsis cynos]